MSLFCFDMRIVCCYHVTKFMDPPTGSQLDLDTPGEVTWLCSQVASVFQECHGCFSATLIPFVGMVPNGRILIESAARTRTCIVFAFSLCVRYGVLLFQILLSPTRTSNAPAGHGMFLFQLPDFHLGCTGTWFVLVFYVSCFDSLSGCPSGIRLRCVGHCIKRSSFSPFRDRKVQLNLSVVPPART